MMETIPRVMRSELSAVSADAVKLLRVVLEKAPVTYKMTVVALDESYICVGLDTSYLLLMVLLLCPVNILM